MRGRYIKFIILSIFIFFLSYLTEASDVSLENDLQKGLKQGKIIVKRAVESYFLKVTSLRASIKMQSTLLNTVRICT